MAILAFVTGSIVDRYAKLVPIASIMHWAEVFYGKNLNTGSIPHYLCPFATS